ncbi:hypothetical protein [Ornithinimicrobium kibberense]|uniref:hypothetical protein n=1 Tax=Ornithinimicrobium kibberense TaxID=282060 RepID=UPI003617C4C2
MPFVRETTLSVPPGGRCPKSRNWKMWATSGAAISRDRRSRCASVEPSVMTMTGASTATAPDIRRRASLCGLSSGVSQPPSTRAVRSSLTAVESRVLHSESVNANLGSSNASRSRIHCSWRNHSFGCPRGSGGTPAPAARPKRVVSAAVIAAPFRSGAASCGHASGRSQSSSWSSKNAALSRQTQSRENP